MRPSERIFVALDLTAEAEARALQLVKDHESIIRALADALVEHETLDAAALEAVIKPDTAVPV